MILRIAPAIFLILATLLLQGGCSKKDDKADTKAAGDQGAKDSGKTPQGPPVEVSSEQLAKEYVTDPRAADARYKNKLLQVKGTVATVNKIETMNRIYLTGYKKTPTESYLDRPIRCAVRPEVLDKVPLLSRGQMVQVTGKCTDGGALGVNLADCDFKELEPSSVITISAEALTKEFAAAGKNDLSVHKKYNNKEVIVEGTVADVVPRQVLSRVILAGQAPWTVSCKFGLKAEFQQLKKGQKARIRGVYEDFANNQVNIQGETVLKAK